MNQFKQYLLTDFSLPRWTADGNTVDLESVKSCIDAFNANGEACGEIVNNQSDLQTDFGINTENVSHRIQNVTIVDNKIYGDVIFLDLPLGLIAADAWKTNLAKFAIRGYGDVLRNQANTKSVSTFQKIITWDIIPSTEVNLFPNDENTDTDTTDFRIKDADVEKSVDTDVWTRKDGMFPDSTKEYIYRLDTAWTIPHNLHSVAVPQNSIVYNVIGTNSRYQFTLKETGEVYTCHYAWAFAENTPENVKVIKDFEKFEKKVNKMVGELTKMRKAIVTLAIPLEDNEDEASDEVCVD